MGNKKLVKSTKSVSQKSRKHFKYRSNECLNCGQPLDLSDVYCPYCSQLNSTKALSLKDFIGEFVNSIVSYDSRLRYTVFDLLFRPGKITRNYIEGQRLKYANPFRFFLSVSIIYFILFGIINTYVTNEGAKFNSNFTEEAFNETFDGAKTPQEDIEINGIPGFKMSQTIQDSVAIREKLKKDSIAKANPKYITKAALDTIGWSQRIYEKLDTYVDFYENTKIKDANLALDSLKHDNTKFNRYLYDRNMSIERVKSNPFGFVNYLIGKTPFFLFFFAPVYALFFWLLYCRTKRTYMEHLVFIFHIFSFVFIALFIVSIFETIIDTSILSGILFLLIGPFYFYKALRNFYRQHCFITILKFLILNFVFLTGASVFATLFFFITAAVY